jgi:hypothetical protein
MYIMPSSFYELNVSQSSFSLLNRMHAPVELLTHLQTMMVHILANHQISLMFIFRLDHLEFLSSCREFEPAF